MSTLVLFSGAALLLLVGALTALLTKSSGESFLASGFALLFIGASLL